MHTTDPRSNDNNLNQLPNPKWGNSVVGTFMGRAKSTPLFDFHGFSPFQSVSPILILCKGESGTADVRLFERWWFSSFPTLSRVTPQLCHDCRVATLSVPITWVPVAGSWWTPVISPWKQKCREAKLRLLSTVYPAIQLLALDLK
jgi:hypothetical protein